MDEPRGIDFYNIRAAVKCDYILIPIAHSLWLRVRLLSELQRTGSSRGTEGGKRENQIWIIA